MRRRSKTRQEPRRSAKCKLPNNLQKASQLFQNRLAEGRLLNAAQAPRPLLEDSAPQGLNISSRGQRPRKRAPSPPFPSPRLRGEGCRRRGVGPWSGGFTPGYSYCSPAGSTASRAGARPQIVFNPNFDQIFTIIRFLYISVNIPSHNAIQSAAYSSDPFVGPIQVAKYLAITSGKRNAACRPPDGP